MITKKDSLKKVKSNFGGNMVIVTMEDDKEVRGLLLPTIEEKEVLKYYKTSLGLDVDPNNTLVLYMYDGLADKVSFIDFEGVKSLNIGIGRD